MVTRSRLVQFLPYALLIVLLALVLQRAWVSDDAYITYRTIDNLVNGYRLTWNPAERVQAFTHPLWMLILTVFYFFTREIYLTSILVSILFTLLAAWLLKRSAISPLTATFCLLVLCLSNAFIDYSTSGLENPPGHLLIIVFALIYLRMVPSVKKLFWLSLVASLAAVNRMDSVLIFAPALLVAFWQTPTKIRAVLAALLGQIPFILWELFSLFYYGFLFPNTAYAKLNTFIPADESTQQGIYYILNSLQRDPLTLLIVMGALIAALFHKDRLRLLSISLGACLYILFVIKIGGDFMSGRFFTLPLIAALVVFSQFDFKTIPSFITAPLFLVVLVTGLFLPPVPTYRMLNPPDVSVIDQYGVADERLWYFSGMGLFRDGRLNTHPEHLWIEEGKLARQEHINDVVIREGIGLYGYYAGPRVYIIDVHALSDPLLARLPAKRWVNWQIGHFERVIPDGYTDSKKVDYPAVTDRNLREFETRLEIITRGDLFSMERLIEIWKMNTGQYNGLIETNRYQFPNMVYKMLDQVSQVKPAGIAWNAPGNTTFGDQGLDIDLQGTQPGAAMEVSLDGSDHYLISFMNQDKVLDSILIPAETPGDEKLVVHTYPVPPAAHQKNCDHIRILPVRSSGTLTLDLIRGDNQYSLGHLIFR